MTELAKESIVIISCICYLVSTTVLLRFINKILQQVYNKKE